MVISKWLPFTFQISKNYVQKFIFSKPIISSCFLFESLSSSYAGFKQTT